MDPSPPRPAKRSASRLPRRHLLVVFTFLLSVGLGYASGVMHDAAAAAIGGITTVLCTPDTNPVIDNSAVVELIHRMARKLGQTRILTTGALTRGLDGEHLAEMAALKHAGCVAVSNEQLDDLDQWIFLGMRVIVR